MKIIIFAGAGISAESGLSTFRDTDGIWNKYDLNDVCNINTFLSFKNIPEKRKYLFDFYNKLKIENDRALPNDAHNQIKLWQETFGEDRVKIVTSNVDSMFEKAGVKDVLHIHGDFSKTHCVACQHEWLDEYYLYDKRCPKCNSRLTKPKIIFFGEHAPNYKHMFHIFNYKKRNPNDFIVAIGTSFNVITAEDIVQRKNAKTILINKDKTEDDHWFYHQFFGNATEQIHLADNILRYYF